MPKELRPYQVEAANAWFNYFESGGRGNQVIVVPMRLGKSLIMAEIIKRLHEINPRIKILSLANDSQLLRQNEAELREHWPFISTCFFSAKLKKKVLYGDVIFASIQSIYKRSADIKHKIDLIFVDESQGVSTDDTTMYRKFFDEMKIKNPSLKITGFTGTPFRSDSGYLHHGAKRLFTDISYNITIDYAINEGYWCTPITPRMNTQIDVSGVKTTKNDFVQSELSKVVDREEITRECVKEIVANGAQYKSWIVYTIDAAHCQHVCDELRSQGVNADLLHSNLSPAQQDEVIKRYMKNEIKCLVCVTMMTVGFNKPDLDLVVLLRPTQSPVLYLQTACRGCTALYAEGYDLSTRDGRLAAIANGPKPVTAVFDFGGVIDRLGPIDDVEVPTIIDSNGNGEPPTKICHKCFMPCHAGVRECPHCGYEFPRSVKITKRASNSAILTSQQPEKWLRVDNVFYSKYEKDGRPPSILAKYYCNGRQVWVWYFYNFKHDDSIAFWVDSAGTESPVSVDEFMDRRSELRKPLAISVKREGKYDKIKKYDYDGSASNSRQ